MREIGVSLPDDVLAAVTRIAERDCRSLAAQIRFYVTEAVRRNGHTTQREPWPPELMSVGPHNLAEAKRQVAELQAEYDRLRGIERRTPTGLLPHQDEALRFARDRIDQLNRQIGPIERMQGVRS
jgi:hypothetical protein